MRAFVVFIAQALPVTAKPPLSSYRHHRKRGAEQAHHAGEDGKPDVHPHAVGEPTHERAESQARGLSYPEREGGNAKRNLGAVYRQFNKTLKKAYEGLGNTKSVYNAFVQANINVVKVFITKQVRANGGSVLAPYQITRGTLPSIAYAKGADEVLVTDLKLGGLVISAQTEVGELAEAIIGHNAEWENGDQLTLLTFGFPPSRLGNARASSALRSAWRRFYGRQTVDAVTGTPRAVISGTKVLLDVTDTTLLWDMCGSLGFASVAVAVRGVFRIRADA